MLLLFLQHLVMVSGEAPFHGHHHQHLQRSLHTDKLALLEFKKAVLDPKSNLSNWNETTDVCNFTGIICLHRHRVSQLILPDVGLVGQFPPLISNLTGLRIIDLTNNILSGIIPHQISYLRHLRVLLLDGNNLHGPISDSFSLTKLRVLGLSNNSLNGNIPPSLFSNCSSLANVDLSQNFFLGEIPAEIGNCPNLWNLNLYNNQFTGQIPLSLTNASTMYSLDVEYNHLSGELPSQLVSKLPQLSFLHLSYNNMVSHDGNKNLGSFFSALANCTALEELELAGMRLGGNFPSSVGQLSTNLKALWLQENQIFGSIPPSLANLTGLMSLNLTYNFLNGTISPGISKLPILEQLFLAYNRFTGKIPEALGECPHLGRLDLSNNRFSGKIPESFGNLVQIRYLYLNNNLLSGEIPPSLGKCKDLSSLDLSHNRLTGNITPAVISGLHKMYIYLNLSHNNLEGPLPLEISKLENVLEIDLSSNNLNGNIFAQISSCIALEMIDLSSNSFQGKLPETLGDLKNLKAFDVSRNKISGQIPGGLSRIHTLHFINLSVNNFEGTIPFGGVFNSVTNLSFLGNPRLCGPVVGIPTCTHRKKYFHSTVFLVTFCVVIAVSVFVSVICCVRWYLRAMQISTTLSQPERKSAPDVMHNFPRITYKELSEATGGFDDQRLVGSGGYGRVYKGMLPDGTTIAVKVLQLQTGNSTKSFTRECQVLKRIRHRNLIRIITACSLPDFKALVLPFMANGSLDSRLYPPGTGLHSGSSDLNLIQRVNICSDIAEGMSYLHHHSPVRVIHCDLKPSNILLDEDMVAHVGDFGLAKLLLPQLSNTRYK